MAEAGSTITVGLTGPQSGASVTAWLFSDPISLGTYVVSDDGTIEVVLPAGVTGEHKLAVYGSDGDLIGWAPIRLVAPGGEVTPPPTESVSPTPEPSETPESSATPTPTPSPDAPVESDQGLADTGSSTSLIAGALAVLALMAGAVGIALGRRR